jgi:hypothetical protein
MPPFLYLRDEDYENQVAMLCLFAIVIVIVIPDLVLLAWH